MKIDVEGAEWHVLRGLLPLLKDRRVGFLWAELDSNNQIVEDNINKVAELADSVGYHFFRNGMPVDIRQGADGNMLLRPS